MSGTNSPLWVRSGGEARLLSCPRCNCGPMYCVPPRLALTDALRENSSRGMGMEFPDNRRKADSSYRACVRRWGFFSHPPQVLNKRQTRSGAISVARGRVYRHAWAHYRDPQSLAVLLERSLVRQAACNCCRWSGSSGIRRRLGLGGSVRAYRPWLLGRHAGGHLA